MSIELRNLVGSDGGRSHKKKCDIRENKIILARSSPDALSASRQGKSSEVERASSSTPRTKKSSDNRKALNANELYSDMDASVGGGSARKVGWIRTRTLDC